MIGESWKGANVRELLSTLKSAESLDKSIQIEREQIPKTTMDLLKKPDSTVFLPELPLPVSLKEYEVKIIEKALNTFPTQAEAARALGMKTKTLQQRINRGTVNNNE